MRSPEQILKINAGRGGALETHTKAHTGMFILYKNENEATTSHKKKGQWKH